MRRPFEHTLTPADRIFFQKCLLGASAFYGSLTLLIVSFVIASHGRTIATQTETTAVLQSASQDDLTCPSPLRAGHELCPQTRRNGR